MPSQLKPFNLLILTAQEDKARTIITTLRNGGLPARGIYTNQYDRLTELAEGHQVAIDLILCCLSDPEIDLDPLLEHYQEIEADVPLILLSVPSHDPGELLQALRGGARDVVTDGEVERLQLVVARELADLRARQALAATREQLERAQQRVWDLAEVVDEAIAYLRAGTHLFANSAYRRRFALVAGEVLDSLSLPDLVVPKDRETVASLIAQAETFSGEPPPPQVVSVMAQSKDGQAFPAVLSIAPDEHAGARCVRIKVADAGREIARDTDALVDSATGLPGRQALMEALSERLARAKRGDRIRFALIYIGINEPHEILQQVGLLRGYEIIATISQTLKRITPADGLLTRFADDSFALLLDTDEQATATQLAVTIRHEVRLPEPLAGRDTAYPDCRTGLVFFDREGPSLRELLDSAYADAFTRVIENGPTLDLTISQQHEASQDASSQLDAADREIGQMIDEALTNDGLMLVYQPIVSLLGDTQENYSVFVRLLDDKQRLHEARDLIGPAVRTHQIQAVDRWVLEKAIAQIAEQRKGGQRINFFVNLAEETFRDSALLLWVCDLMRESEIRGNWLTFQFQEVHARQHLARLAKLVEGMKKIKSRIAISRFGQDKQPESLLQTLQADYVLFSPGFAHQLNTDSAKQKQLMALAKLAREFNVKTIVTGVEEATTLTVLWGAGIDYVQGNFLQRPSTALNLSQEGR